MKTRLTTAEKEHLFQQGYVIVRGVVTPKAVKAARELIENYLPKDQHRLLVPGELATQERITGLYNDHAMAQIIQSKRLKFI